MRDVAGQLLWRRSLHRKRDVVERFRAAIRRDRPSGSPRIALIGNCQADAMARAMRLLCPAAELRFLSVGALGRRRRSADGFLDMLAGADFVFAQEIASGYLGPEHYAALADRHPGYGRVPAFVFAAFHPDLIYIGGPGVNRSGKFVQSAIGDYNSAIALYAFLEGWPVERTLRLFNREAFAFVSYLDWWPHAQEALLALGRNADMDLAPELLRWARRGCFMHSTNHPKMHVVADLARLVLRRAGIPFTDFDLDGFLVDDLSVLGTWPVYEPIARLYGVPGCYVFQQQGSRRAAERRRIFSLPEFVTGSFASYRRYPRRELVSDRVEAWLADDTVRATLRSFAQ